MTDAATMWAVRMHQQGDPDVLVYEEVARPAPGAGDVLIEVHAAGVNPPDWYARTGFQNVPGLASLPAELLPPPLAFPHTLGSDVSGVVAALGDGVTDWRVGDEVFGLVRFPDLNNGGRGYAQYTTSPAGHLARKPAGVDHVHAAAVPMSGLTAYQYLLDYIDLELTSDTRVLVNGAAGGVGHFLVQLLAARGAQVTAVAAGRHDAFVRGLGAETVIDYETTAADEVVRDVDLVLDTVGGPDGHRFLAVLRRGGVLAPVFAGDYHPERAAELGITMAGGQVRSDGEQLGALAELLADGRVRAGIDSVYPLADAAEAHRRGERGHLEGKIVLRVDGH